MKKMFALWWCAVVLLILVLAHPRVSRAGGWDDMLKALSAADTIRDGVQESGTVYCAKYSFTVTNQDGTPNDLGPADRVALNLTSIYTNQSLSFSGTRAELNSWAQQHAAEIYAIVEHVRSMQVK